MPRWTHRPTWEDCRDSDRLICRDGQAVGRTYQHKSGPQDGRWLWAGSWIGPDNHGTAATLAMALKETRAAYERIAEADPRRLV